MYNSSYSISVGSPEAEILSRDAAKLFLNLFNDDTKNDLVDSLIIAARQEAEEYTWRSLAKKPYMQTMDRFPGHSDSGFIGSIQQRVYLRGYGLGHHHQVIKLRNPPLISVDNITYIGQDGIEHSLLPGTDFQVDVINEPGRIAPLPGAVWPLISPGVLNAIRIFYTAGYEVKSTLLQQADPTTQDTPEPETETVSGAPTPPQQVVSYTVDRTIPSPIVTAIKQLVVHRFQNRDPVVVQAGAGGIKLPLPWHVEQTLNTYRCFDFSLAG
jgi:hypothetical protein